MKTRSMTKPVRLECVNRVRNRWAYRYALSENDGVWEYEETVYDHEPAEDELMRTRNGYYDALTRERIESGWSWEGHAVWLSVENQHNHTAALSVALATGGMNLPYRVKVGSEDSPEFVDIKSTGELSAFVQAMQGWIAACVEEGWKLKNEK